ncbi:ABC transporter ATP-binding protein [Terriglobus roseus]|uniref:Phospholipid/cholesterol/gamma-HCH transport system ATP-binding protein n=1 Tax=Terriglobus roseus TaxID=392734 RepID=A0A1H4J9X2_9BACT|nr:ATP-binding cassette domain-containing protein [Terriglobus roseus]SEB42438.1 phospholipid/cholesterol/gamma-HCH transport system ATP-binding protein [Terriglobus roseus]
MPDQPLEDQNKLQKQDQVLRDDESAQQDVPLTADEQATEELLNKPLVDEVSEDVAEEVGEFFEQSKEQNEVSVEDSRKPYISFEHVFKSFGDFKVLEDVSFFVKPGETLCILGRSGVGKSVSLQMLMGFLKPDKGIISVANENICGFNEKEMQPIRRKVTMVFQNGALFDSVSVGENVAFPLREKGELEEEQIRQVVKGLLEMVGVAGMDDLLPSDLSTGMKRSVAIARALAAQPEAVLYDEPTTMVDPLMAHLLGDLIERLKRQLHLTSIVVTHDMRFAKKLADRLLFLHEGTARFFGTLAELEKSDDPILRDFMALDELVLPQ